MFWLFFLNSGGRDLPGEPVEIDFRPILENFEKILIVFLLNFNGFHLFALLKNECFMVQTFILMVPNQYFIIF